MTSTAAAATSPYVSYDLVTLNYHTATWASTVVLAAFCLWLADRPRKDLVPPATVLVTVLAGTTLASDYLFAFVAVVPFGLAGLVLMTLPGLRWAGRIVMGSALAAPLIGWLTTSGMRAAHVEVFSIPIRFADDTALWPNLGR